MIPDRISRILSAFVDGELGARQRQAVERLLRRSSEARQLLQELQQDAEQLRRLPSPALRPDFSEEVLQHIARMQAASGRRLPSTMRSPVPPWLGLATAAAAVFLVVGLRSYLSFAIVGPQQEGRLAIKNPQPHPPEIAQAEEARPTPPQPTGPELLHHPMAESTRVASSSPAIAQTDDGKAQSRPQPPPVLASPLQADTVHLNDPEEHLALVFPLGDLVDAEKRRLLRRELQKGAVHALELRCNNTVAGMERLQAAFQAQGIHWVLDPDAQAALKLGLGKNTAFALYFEDVTAEEVVTILQQLPREDRNAERKRPGSGRFEGLLVNAMTPQQQQKFWRLFGMDPPARSETPMPKEAAGVEFRKPASPSMEEGSSRVEPLQKGRKIGERLAMVIAYTPGRPRPPSTELKRFVDNRRERRAGTLQIFLLLSAPKS